MSRPDRWMPLDWGDYWRDTGHLNVAEHGAYLNLLGHYWVSGKPLPDNDDRLHRLARTTWPEWLRMRVTLRTFFTAIDGTLRHKRVEREIARANEVYERKSRAANTMHAKRKRVRGDVHDDLHVQSTTQSQPQSPDSVPTGTGAAPPLGGEGTDVDADLFGASPSASQTTSLKARIFGPCLAWLSAQAKLPEASARKIAARWCAAHGDGAVLSAFAAAARQSPLDPVPYIEKVLNNANTSPATAPRRGAAPPFQSRVAAAAREQAASHLIGLKQAIFPNDNFPNEVGVGDMAPARPDAARADHGLIIDADEPH